MKVLQILGEGGWGGGSVVVLSITQGLLARGDEVVLACREGENARRFREAGAKVVHPPLWFHPINPFDAAPFLYLVALCRRERFDLVATHTSKGGFLGRLAARAANVPSIVHHAHGFAFNKVLGPLTRKFFVGLERFAAKAGDFIISVNDQQRREAIQLGVVEPSRVHTVHNGINLESSKTADRFSARRELGISDSDLLIGAVGRLAPQKGFVYLLRAMPFVLASVPNARLAVVGDGPLSAELEEEVRRAGVADRVRFLGFRRDVRGLLAAFDVFALPSLWEGLSISLIEALAAGKPIVATDIDGNREVVEHMKTGLMVPPADVPALASALQMLLVDRALAAGLATRARASAEARFSVQRMVDENLAVYDRVVASGRRGPQRARGQRMLSGPGLTMDSTSSRQHRAAAD